MTTQVGSESKTRKPRTRNKNSEPKQEKGKGNSEPVRKPFIFEQTRKALPYDILAKSNTVLDYLNRNGGRAVGAFQRIAALNQLTQRNNDIRTRLTEWLNCRLTLSQEEVAAFEAKAISFKADVVIEPISVVVPETFTYRIDVTHPIFWRFIGIFEAVDRNIAEFENMWIAGLIDDESMIQSRNDSLTIITDLVASIYQITNASRDREGGLYDTNDYKAIMTALSAKSTTDK